MPTRDEWQTYDESDEPSELDLVYEDLRKAQAEIERLRAALTQIAAVLPEVVTTFPSYFLQRPEECKSCQQIAREAMDGAFIAPRPEPDPER